MSSIKLEENDIMSSGQQTRYINIRYIFTKDRIKDGNINIINCPTERMVAGYFTKSLQGSLFRRLRNVIMGVTHPDFFLETLPPLVTEHVGIHISSISETNKVSKIINAPSGGVSRHIKVNPTYTSILISRRG